MCLSVDSVARSSATVLFGVAYQARPTSALSERCPETSLAVSLLVERLSTETPVQSLHDVHVRRRVETQIIIYVREMEHPLVLRFGQYGAVP